MILGIASHFSFKRKNHFLQLSRLLFRNDCRLQLIGWSDLKKLRFLKKIKQKLVLDEFFLTVFIRYVNALKNGCVNAAPEPHASRVLKTLLIDY